MGAVLQLLSLFTTLLYRVRQEKAPMKRMDRPLKLEELDPTSHDIRPLTLLGMFVPQNARECVEFMPRVYELPKDIQRRLRDTVWLSGCASWYLDAHGRNTTIWPGFTWEYRLRTRRFRPADYSLTPRGEPA